MRTVLSVAFVLLLVGACNKPPGAPAFDSGPAPAATDAAPMQLAPVVSEDAGSPVDAAVPPVKHSGGPGLTNNQARAKQCCSALRAEAKSLGASPEANLLTSFAAQCDMVAMQMGPTSGGQAPEFAGIRTLLKGHNIPGVCNGL